MIGIYTFIEAVWLMFPAYGANGLCMIARGKRPIDFGRTFRGKPVFGPGKTWEGLIAGIILAITVASFQRLVFPFIPWDLSPVTLDIVAMSPFLGLVIGLGAMVGDLGGSFIKRRLGLERGKPFPLLDQLDFIIGMFVFLSFVITVKWEWVVILFILTPVVHLIANGIAYLLRIKKVPY
jgi:CDP-2,3-bis-(O-geranylgeranyl)-sn-glycerol synthase